MTETNQGSATQFPWRERLLASPAIAVAVFCLGLLSCTGLGVALVMSLIDKGGALISVTGMSSELIKSDRVQWSFDIRSNNANRSIGARKHQEKLNEALSFLRTNGVREEDIVVKVINVSEEIERNPKTGKETSFGWNFNQEIVVISEDVDKVASVSRKSSEMISAGIDARLQRPKYTFSGLSDKRIELLEGATENAKQRANAIATQGNLSLGRMTNVGTAIFQITAPGSNAAGGGGRYETDTIDKEISAVMSVSFRLK